LGLDPLAGDPIPAGARFLARLRHLHRPQRAHRHDQHHRSDHEAGEQHGTEKQLTQRSPHDDRPLSKLRTVGIGGRNPRIGFVLIGFFGGRDGGRGLTGRAPIGR
jgi:hypothetical protein